MYPQKTKVKYRLEQAGKSEPQHENGLILILNQHSCENAAPRSMMLLQKLCLPIVDYFNTVCNMSKKPKFCSLLFCLSYFSFLVTLGSDVTEIQRYYVIFVYIFQGKMGKTGKKRNENHTTKVTKIPKAKRRKNMG